MSCNVYSVPEEKTSPLFAKAFVEGCGGRVLTQYEPGHWAGFVSPKNWHDVKKAALAGFDYYFGDHAYFGRGKYYRVTKNAAMHNGRGVSDGRRLKEFWGRPKPCKKDGSVIILCPQSEHFFSRYGMTQQGWIDHVTKELRKYTDRDIIVHHKRDAKPLRSLFDDAWMVAGMTSMSCLDALLHGIPAIVTAPCAIWQLSTPISSVEKPFYPENRMEVAAVLADNQWTFEEMKSGACWRVLNGLG